MYTRQLEELHSMQASRRKWLADIGQLACLTMPLSTSFTALITGCSKSESPSSAEEKYNTEASSIHASFESDPYTRVFYYNVRGSNLAEIIKAAEKRMPLEHANNSNLINVNVAQTRTYIALAVDASDQLSDPNILTKEGLVSISAISHAHLILPHLTSYETLSRQEREEWSRFFLKILIHEKGHIEIGKANASKFLDKCQIEFKKTGSLKASDVGRLYRQSMKDLADAHIKYDVDTESGKSQGAYLDRTVPTGNTVASQTSNQVVSIYDDLFGLPGVSFAFYPLRGHSLNEIRQQLSNRGPFKITGAPKNEDKLGNLPYLFTYYLSWNIDDSGANAEWPKTAVQLNMQFLLPELRDVSLLSKVDREAWDNFNKELLLYTKNLISSVSVIAKSFNKQANSAAHSLRAIHELGNQKLAEMQDVVRAITQVSPEL